MAEHEEADKVAVELAERFGETEERPRAQLQRMARLMGAVWMREAADDAELVRRVGAPERIALKDGASRAPGGVFFMVARDRAMMRVAAGVMTRRQFFRCFTDRPPQPKAPQPLRPKREKKPKAPAPPRPAQGGWKNQRSPRGQAPTAEVYVTRRRPR